MGRPTSYKMPQKLKSSGQMLLKKPEFSLLSTASMSVPPKSSFKPRKIRFDGENAVALTLIIFDQLFFLKSKQLNRRWRAAIMEGLDDFCNPIENRFVSTYFDCLFFRKSFSWAKKISFCGKQRGLRIERVIECEVIR